MKQKDLAMIDDNDMILRVRPYENDDGSWNGEIDISIISQPENTFSDDDYFQIMHFCKMMASTVPIMENNEKIREMVHDYVVNVVDSVVEVVLEDDYEDEKPTIVSRDKNIISIDFKTKGNA